MSIQLENNETQCRKFTVLGWRIVLSDFQSGLRLSHSTITTLLLKVTEDLRTAMESDFESMLVLLGFSNGFDCMNHPLFIYKLRTLFTVTRRLACLWPLFWKNECCLWKQLATSLQLEPSPRRLNKGLFISFVLFFVY
jgi:hypothetical protein